MVEQVLPCSGRGGGQITYAHVNDCKNDKIRFKKMKNTKQTEFSSPKTKRDLSQEVNDFLIEQTAIKFIKQIRKTIILIDV